MRRSREERIQIVEQFERSGQSHEAFCSQHRLNVGSFRGWLYRLRGGPQLLPVRVATAGAVDDETVIELAVGDAMMPASNARSRSPRMTLLVVAMNAPPYFDGRLLRMNDEDGLDRRALSFLGWSVMLGRRLG